MEIACPVAISRVQEDVDLNDDMTFVRKNLNCKQLRWYFRVFLKMIMIVTFIASMPSS